MKALDHFSRRPGVALHWLFVIASICSARADWIATGKFNYTDRLYDLNGFTGTALRPVREADVQVYDTSTFAVLASGATDSSGSFSVAVTDSLTRTVGVRVLSSNVQVASLNFSVVDDKNANAVYSYHDATVDQATHSPAVDVNFGTMTMPLSIGDVATTDWSSQVFNVYDMGLLLADWIANVDGARPSVFFTVGWNPTNGRTGSSYSGGTNRLSLSDDDGYDDPNILHEMGHYIEDEYGRSRNTGGTHTIGDNDEDPRLAYSEGFATFVSAAALDFGGRDRPDIYQDRGSFTSGSGGGFSYTCEIATVGGSTNEQAATAALYDLIDTSATLDDTPGSDDDSIGSQQAGVWAVVKQMRVLNLTATSLEDFWDIWFSIGLGNAAALTSVFASHNVDFAPDAQEPNDAPATSTVLTVNGAYQRNSFFRSGDQAGGDEDWFQFTATAGTYYSVEVNGAGNSIFGRPDPEMWLIDPDLLTVLAYNDDPYDSTLNTQSSSNAQDMVETVPAILWQAPASGTYFVYVRHASQERNLLGRYGTYNIRVRSLAAPTPTITGVSEQRMLQGQAYQVLVVGTNFARGATVSTSAPGVAVTKVNWIAPTALVATLTPSAAVADGSYSLIVANPGGGSATSAGAFEVSSSAQPPVMITEVNLSGGTVELKNFGTVSASLAGWVIQSLEPSTSTQTYTFPSFTLAASATVVVHESSGTNTATDLYDLTNSFNWPWGNGSSGDVSLLDEGSRNVDFIRVISSPTSTHSAPRGTGGAWTPPQLQSPSSGFTIARSESTALFRTPFGLSWAESTMPAGAAGRENNVDPWEDNDQPRRAPILNQTGLYTSLRISARPSGADADWFGFVVKPGDTLVFQTAFSHTAGNLDMELYAPGQESTPLLSSTSTTDNEVIVLTSTQSNSTGGGIYRLRVFGVSGAANTYTLVTANHETADIAVTQSVPLSDGVGSVDFGAIAVGSGSSLTFTIANAGATDLTLGGITKGGLNSGDFSVNSTGMPATIPAGGTTTFVVTFSPAGIGGRSATIHIESSDADENPFDVELTGTAFLPDIAVQQPEGVSLTDGGSTVDFGNVFVGSVSVKRFAIRNSGSGLLELSSVTLGGTNAAEFSAGVLTSANLQVGDTAFMDVTFSPTAPSARSAVLHISSNDPYKSPFDISLAGAGTTPGASVMLVRDINRAANGLSPTSSVAIGSQVFFVGTTLNEGAELWRTDGTTSGTYLVKDIYAGTNSSGMGSLTNFNGTLFFSALDSTNGAELWKSDGTAGGTVLVKNIASGNTSSSPANFTVAGTTLFFTANDITNGTELWKTDGTTSGTVMVANIASGITSSSPANLRNVNGTLFFTANDSVNGTELWKSDGTSAGTVLVADIVAGSTGSSPSNLNALGSVLIFTVNDGSNGLELWISDGTASGTVLLKDINPGSVNSSPSNFASMGGYLYFSATTATEGTELWKTNGTAAGTVLVQDIYSGTGSSSPSNLTVVGNNLFFSAFDAVNGREPWTSDGTAAGSVLLRDIASGSGSSSPTLFTEAGGTVFFTALVDGLVNRELWKTNGTTDGTVLVKDINPGTGGFSGANLVNLGGALIFSANDGLLGQELWKSDGSTAGTVLILEGQTGTGSAGIGSLRVVNGTTFLSATDGVNGQELWKTDGTLDGTVLVKDIAAGSSSSFPANLTDFQGTLFFSAFDFTNGTELWKSDGTSAGTVLVKDINTGAVSASPANFQVVGSLLFFTATTATNGTELWVTDGTTTGTVLVADIISGPTSSSPANLTVMGSTLFFSASDGTSSHGTELWKSDGTSSGTVLLNDINPGTVNSSPANFRVIGSRLFFTATTASNGTELWATDGTTAGTVLVADIISGTISSSPAILTVVGSTLYFSASDGPSSHGTELWKSDGTSAGTVMVKDIAAGTTSSSPTSMAAVGSTLYFSAYESSTGRELWKSDGTDTGTVLVSDINAGTASSSPSNTTSANGNLYMSATASTTGAELWRSDGTAAGTTQVADIMPGAGSSSPAALTVAGNHLFFTARQPELGASELFVIDLPPPAYSISGTIACGGIGLTGVTVTPSPSGGAVATDGSGSYSVAGLAAGTYTITPSQTGYAFSPSTLNVTVGPDATGQDFIADATEPATPTVIDDGAVQISRTQLHAVWSASDGESGIAEYQYGIGTGTSSDAERTNVSPWTSTGTSSSITRTGLNLSGRVTYYVSVKARNGVGLWSASGVSDGIEILVPAINSEPEATLGTSNTVSWPVVAGADQYYVEMDTDPNFGSPDASSGWITGLDHTFTGLSNGQTYYYRVKALDVVANGTGSWSQTSQAEFDADVKSNVATTDQGEVVLSGGSSSSLKIFVFSSGVDSGFLDDLTTMGHHVTSNGTWPSDLSPYDVVVLAPNNINGDPVVPTAAVDAFTASGGGLVIFENTVHTARLSTSAASCPVSAVSGWVSRSGTTVVNASNPLATGLGSTSTLVGWSTSPTLKPGADVALQWAGGVPMAVTYSNGAGNIAYVNDLWAWYAGDWRGDYAYGVNLMRNILGYVATPYAPSGSIVTSTVAPNPFRRWGALTFTKATPANTALTVDILDGAGNVLASDVASGTDLNDLGITVSPIKLRANLSTIDISVTPSLLDWAVAWLASVNTNIESEWSTPVHSTQDASSPAVAITGPINGVTYTTPQTVVIDATATDNVGLAKVEFYDGILLKATDTASPYNYVWAFTSANDGFHNWTAVAYDVAGHINTSSVVAVMVGITDSDGDGISDVFEDAHGFNKIDPGDANLDADGDGKSNLDEFLAGTHPRNTASSFHVTAAAMHSGGEIVITWATVPGKRYQAQVSSDLRAYTPLGDPVTAGPSDTALTLIDHPTSSSQFYRVILAP